MNFWTWHENDESKRMTELSLENRADTFPEAFLSAIAPYYELEWEHYDSKIHGPFDTGLTVYEQYKDEKWLAPYMPDENNLVMVYEATKRKYTLPELLDYLTIGVFKDDPNKVKYPRINRPIIFNWYTPEGYCEFKGGFTFMFIRMSPVTLREIAKPIAINYRKAHFRAITPKPLPNEITNRIFDIVVKNESDIV